MHEQKFSESSGQPEQGVSSLRDGRISHTSPQNVLFCGSREWVDEDTMRADMARLLPGSLIVHGGQRGADMMADRLARKRGLHVAKVDALWDYYGTKAGPFRNQAMLRIPLDFAFCYPMQDSVGTWDMVRRLSVFKVPHAIRGLPEHVASLAQESLHV